MAYVVLELASPEFEHLMTTLEGCYEELEMLMKDVDWYTTELTDRVTTCIEIINGAKREQLRTSVQSVPEVP